MIPAIDIVEYNLPGVVLSVAEQDGSFSHFCTGLSNIEKQTPMHADLLFQAGKIARLFTASVILQLVESQHIALDVPLEHFARENRLDDGRLALIVSQYPYLKPITLRELLNTTSGLPAYEKTDRYLKMIFSKPKRVWQLEGYLDLITGQDFNYRLGYQPPPRGVFGDAATNYVVAGLVVEAATGKRFSHTMRDFFLEANLQQTHYSSYGVLDQMLLPQLSRGYLPLSHPHAQAFEKLPVLHYNNNRELRVRDVTQEYNSNGLGGSAVLSTTSDLIKVLRGVVSGNLLKEVSRHLFESVPLHRESRARGQQSRDAYGLGIYKTDSKRYGEIIWNAGNSYGYSVLLAHAVEKDVTFCLATNVSQQSFNVHSYGLIAEVLRSLLA